MPTGKNMAQWRYRTATRGGWRLAVAAAVLNLAPARSGAAENHRRPPAPAAGPPPSAAGDLRPTLDAARRALAEGLPLVAAHRLTLLLQSGNPPLAPGARREAALLLARAQLEGGNARDALNALPPATEEANHGAAAASAAFLRAQAHAALGEWNDALAAYGRAIAADPASSPERDAARFGRAEALRALGRGAEAGRAFEELFTVPAFATPAGLRRAELALAAGQADAAERFLNLVTPDAAAAPTRVVEKHLLKARLLLTRGRPAEAEAALVELLRAAPHGFTEGLLVTAHAALAESRRAQGRINDARAVLVGFLDRYPRHPGLEAVFGRLETLLAEKPPSSLTAMARWSQDDTQPVREALATLTLAHVRERAGQAEAAEALLAQFPVRFPEEPRRVRVLLELANLQLGRRRPDEARATLAQVRTALTSGGGDDAQRREADELDARIALATGDLLGMAATYERIARAPETPPPQAAAADAQAALARLRAGDEEGFTADSRDLEGRFPDQAAAVRGALGLEEALIRAARVAEQPWTDEAAAAALRRFIRQQPGSPQAGAAKLALVELAFGRGDFDAARGEWQTVANAGAPGDAASSSDRADALAVWLADAPGQGRDAAAAIVRARTFLARWPASPLAPGVRLKLGEILFRQEDYPAAQTELEALNAEAGASPAQVENARYLAGLAALRGLSTAGADRAVSLFEDAAKIGGPLRPAARLRQAETLRDRLGKPADAVLVYDAILAVTAPPPSPVTRCAALCGKGETLLADPARAGEAAGLFAQAAAVRDAPLGWRRQALTRQGEALEKAGNTAAALTAYDDALNATDATAGAGVPGGEFVWFYRAGFAAARLLRASGQWKAAIAVYGKVAAPDGPLRAEAETQAQALRLEHFVWDES